MKLVSFYCNIDGSTFYSDCAKLLKNACASLNMDNLIVNEKFGTSWIDNVRAKPIFLLKMLNELNEDFMWLDVDCNIHKKIDFEIATDWLVDFRKKNIPHDYVHCIKNNEKSRSFIDTWIKKIDEQKKGSHTAFISISNMLNLTQIPNGYVSLGISNSLSKKKYFNNG